MTADQYLGQGQVRIDVDTMPGPWMQLSGHEGEREVSSQRPGAGVPEVQTRSKYKHGDITLVKMFNAATDMQLLKDLDAGKTFAGSKITITGLDEDDVAIPGATHTHYGCSVKTHALSDVDANGADQLTLSVTWARAGAA